MVRRAVLAAFPPPERGTEFGATPMAQELVSTSRLGQDRSMKALGLCVAAILLLAGCSNHRVIATADPDFATVPNHAFDTVRTSWGSRGGLVVSTVTLISPGEWVRRESIRVRKAKDTITVCYAVTRRPGKIPEFLPVPTKLIFVVSGVSRDDPRQVLLSQSCGT